jgi:hypothetical protein
MRYDRFTLERSRAKWAVFGWSVYPRYCALEGKPMKVCVDAYDLLDEARAAYPAAVIAEEWRDFTPPAPEEEEPAALWPYPASAG